MVAKKVGDQKAPKKRSPRRRKTMGHVCHVIRLWVEVVYDCDVCPKNGKCMFGFKDEHKVIGCNVPVVEHVAERVIRVYTGIRHKLS